MRYKSRTFMLFVTGLLFLAAFRAESSDPSPQTVDRNLNRFLEVLYPNLDKQMTGLQSRNIVTHNESDGLHSDFVYKCTSTMTAAQLRTLVLYSAHVLGVALVQHIPIVASAVKIQTPRGEGAVQLPLAQSQAIGAEILKDHPDKSAINDRIFDFTRAVNFRSIEGLAPGSNLP